MAMIQCPECGKEVSDKAISCIHCGCPINNQSEKAKEKYNVVTNTSDVSKGAKVLNYVSMALWAVGIYNAFTNVPYNINDLTKKINEYTIPTDYSRKLEDQLAEVLKCSPNVKYILIITIIIFAINLFVINYSKSPITVRKVLPIAGLVLTIISYVLMLSAGSMIFMIFGLCFVPLICTFITELLLTIGFNKKQ